MDHGNDLIPSQSSRAQRRFPSDHFAAKHRSCRFLCIQLFVGRRDANGAKKNVGDFERTSGHLLDIAYSTMGAITERILAGETPAPVIRSTPSMARLACSRDPTADIGICRSFEQRLNSRRINE
jgi:hypothetical protein